MPVVLPYSWGVMELKAGLLQTGGALCLRIWRQFTVQIFEGSVSSKWNFDDTDCI